jgi:hypothetical protein
MWPRWSVTNLALHAGWASPAPHTLMIPMAGHDKVRIQQPTGMRPSIFWIALGLMLALDLLLISADILQRNQVLADSRFLVTRERGFGEIFQYGKAASATVLLAVLAVRQRSRAALLWSLLLAFVACDDSMQLHERAGPLLAAALTLPAIGSLRPQHLGELLFYAIGCLVVATAFVIVWRRADAEDARIMRGLIWSFGALVMCAVGLDALSSFTHGTAVGPLCAVLEDGGEMLALTAFLFSVLHLLARPAGLHIVEAPLVRRGPPNDRQHVSRRSYGLQ